MTELTTEQLDLAYCAWLLARDGRGMVLQPHKLPVAHRLLQLGWLDYEIEDNGEISWWFTPQGETALTLMRDQSMN